MNPTLPRCLDSPLASRPMVALMVGQFLAALADNALFVIVIARVQISGAAWVPLAQAVFVLAYVLLAPFAGAYADALPKGRAMWCANLARALAVLAIAAGLHPLAGYALVGVGAALYSPAKYGILAELFASTRLVKANGLLEGSTIVAILGGAVLGGTLADHAPQTALWIVAGTYAIATLANLLIPHLPPARAWVGMNLMQLLRDFNAACTVLIRDPDARYSLLGTSLFWGAGATLRIVLFAWVPTVLLLQGHEMPARLMALVSLGIVLGAGLAGLTVPLARVNRALFGGMALGPLILLLAVVHTLTPAAVLLVGVGAAGGYFVVPLNALLQERGLATVGPGRALAVQNLAENALMLLCSLGYSALERGGVGPVPVITLFGVSLTLGITALTVWRRRATSRSV